MRKGIWPSLACPLSLDTVTGLQSLAEFFACDLECHSLSFLFPAPCRAAGGEPLPAGVTGPLLFRIFEQLRASGVVVEPVFRKVRAFVSEKPLIYECDEGFKGMTLMEDGTGMNCSSREGEGGLQERARSFSTRASSRKKLPLFRDSCRFCPALAICGHACPPFPREGGGGEPFPGHCRFNQLALQWLLDETARAMKLSPCEGSFILSPGGVL